ncbi:WYL domain-containing protein [uncultured Pontibacter sp.]|uniref:helix-turn-helix transcriptional regulator n=1 Tax=uncultured Pontibacter sp. TaxID=453356 RepID=UPI00261852D4|nr:WYL domain-containing protein [uncultured Pontibacter sp.]
MSKKGYISRYLLILKKLKAKPYVAFNELQQYIKKQLNYLQMQDDTLQIGFSKRTLQRDIREIRNIFGIEIEYSPTEKGYFIRQTEMENMNFRRMIEAFDLFNSLNAAQDISPYIQLENRKSQGVENMYGLLHAIKNRYRIHFAYQKYWEDDASDRLAEPYALKEFRNRWYVIVKDMKDGNVKSFALDRLSDLQITNQQFKDSEPFKLKQSYQFCFGIISPNAEQPEDVVLSFTSFQGKFIKALPLHDTQQILLDNDDELRVQLRLYITHDFVMELLSYGAELTVLAPLSLQEELTKVYTKALTKYR